MTDGGRRNPTAVRRSDHDGQGPGAVDIVTAGSPAAASANRFDVNGDAATTPLDVLCLINDLNRNSTSQPARSAAQLDRPDVNRDGIMSAQDLVQIIDYWNSQASS